MEQKSKMDQEEYDFYQRLREKIDAWFKSGNGKKHKYAKYLIWAPDLFHLLVKLSLDDEVKTRHKAKLAVAIAYFISPLDLLPEGIIGPVGYIDDIALAAYTLNGIINETSSERIKKHWAGEEDVAIVLQQIIKFVDRTLGSGIVKKLRNKL